MQTVKTRLGEFRVRWKLAVGFSVYRAGRSIGWDRKWLDVGDLFSVSHRDRGVMLKSPVHKLYGAEFVARFWISGKECLSGNSVPPQEVCENDTMSW